MGPKSILHRVRVCGGKAVTIKALGKQMICGVDKVVTCVEKKSSEKRTAKIPPGDVLLTISLD